MSFAKLLTRKRPKLMRRWREDGGRYEILLNPDLEGAAKVTVRLVFTNGAVEDIELACD